MAPPRSVADATRFTATGPHAFTRAHPAPSGETPQQRVARLREAANRAKVDQISTFDRIVDRGRIWADRAHRVVAIGLIGATIICGGITIYAYTDMVMFARRKKRAYAEEQRLLRESQKESHILAAVAAGNDEVSVRQEIEDSERLAQEARKGKPITTRLKEWALSGLTPPEKEAAVGERVITPETQNPAGAAPVMAAAGAPVGSGHVALNRPGADDLVKGEEVKGEEVKGEGVKGGRVEGGGTGMLSSITRWWK